MSRPFKIVLEWDVDAHVWVSHVPELGDISTYDDTLKETITQTREAILGYLETAADERISLPF
ncbi:MAG: HicB family protein [Acidobacteria bacterium]|nr:MAG: HicB family protein [Acidobacteriota bacterium]